MLTTDQVKFDFALSTNVFNSISEREQEFDRWLAKHDRDVKAEAWDEGFDAGVDHSVLNEFVFNPYAEHSEQAKKYIEKKLRETE